MLQDHVLIAKPDGTIVELIHRDEAADNVERHSGNNKSGVHQLSLSPRIIAYEGPYPKNTGLVDFVLKVVNERHYSEAEIPGSYRAAETEMKQNGSWP